MRTFNFLSVLIFGVLHLTVVLNSDGALDVYQEDNQCPKYDSEEDYSNISSILAFQEETSLADLLKDMTLESPEDVIVLNAILAMDKALEETEIKLMKMLSRTSEQIMDYEERKLRSRSFY